MEQLAGSNLRKGYDKAVYCYPVYLTYMWSTSCEMPGWMSYKLESRLSGEVSITSGLMAQSKENLKSCLMRVKEKSEKAGLILNNKKN